MGYAPPTPPKKRGGRWLLSRPVIGIVALFIGLMLGSSGNNSSTTSASGGSTATVTTTATVTAANAAADKAAATVTVTKTSTVTKTAQAPAQAAGATFGDGMWKVGTDVKPGTYKTKVPDSGTWCYWARLSGSGGTLGDILANDNKDPGNTVYVTIKSTDKFFESQDCGTWQLTK